MPPRKRSRAEQERDTLARAKKRADPVERAREQHKNTVARRTARKSETSEAKRVARKEADRDGKRRKRAEATRVALQANPFTGFDHHALAVAISPLQTMHAKNAAVVQFPPNAAAIIKQINQIAAGSTVDCGSSLAWVHGGSASEPAVSMWLSPDQAALIRSEGLTNNDPGWVGEVARLLGKLGEELPDWCTAGSEPAVLIYPTLGTLRALSQLECNQHVFINVESRDQPTHVDQAFMCANHMNFVAPSDGRPFPVIYRINEREAIAIARRGAEAFKREMATAGVFETSVTPDGGGVGIVFSSATPHYGSGGAANMQTSTVFFSGPGAAAALMAEKTPSRHFYEGRLPDGAERKGCGSDGVVTIEDLCKTVQQSQLNTADPVRLGQKFR